MNDFTNHGEKLDLRSPLLAALHRHMERKGSPGLRTWGEGLDEYCAEPRSYPEAYAKYAIGLLNLYVGTGEGIYREWACRLLDELWNLRSPGSLPNWGLPFDYRNVPAYTPYLITGAFCGEAYQLYGELTGDSTAKVAARDVAKWMLTVNGGDKGRDGSYCTLYYAPHQERASFIPNAASVALGFLSRACPEMPLDALRQSLINAQDRWGRWAYSSARPSIDLVHTAYTLEGLVKDHALGHADHVGKVIVAGFEFMWREFYSGGIGAEKALHSPMEILQVGLARVAKDAVLALGPRSLLKRWHPVSRVWGQAAALRILSIAGAEQCVRRRRVAEIVLRHYTDSNGSFVYRPNDKRVFVRHEAHTFEALSFALVAEAGVPFGAEATFQEVAAQ